MEDDFRLLKGLHLPKWGGSLGNYFAYLSGKTRLCGLRQEPAYSSRRVLATGSSKFDISRRQQ